MNAASPDVSHVWPSPALVKVETNSKDCPVYASKKLIQKSDVPLSYRFIVPKTYDGLVVQLGENNPLIYGEDYFTYGDDIVYADQLTNMHGAYVYLCIMSNK